MRLRPNYINVKAYLKVCSAKYFYDNKSIVLGRFACLGHEVMTLLKLEKRSVNFQKSRVDHILNFSKFKIFNINSLYKKLLRKDVFEMILTQQVDFFSFKKPYLILIDSNAELNDRKFTTNKGQSFYANFIDVNPSQKKELIDEGLVTGDILEGLYHDFFTELQTVYPDVPVFFLHYPTFKEKRRKNIERAELIENILSTLEKKFNFLFSISLNNEELALLKSHDEDPFPYHYSRDIYALFSNKVKQNLITIKYI